MATASPSSSRPTAETESPGSGVTLEFESPLFLQSLFAHDHSLLRFAADRLGVTITSRDGWVKIDSDRASATKAATSIFRTLETARRGGAEISAEAFRHAVETAASGGEGMPVEKLLSKRLLGSAQRPAVSPKNEGQARYLEAIEDNTVTFGTGPAGTGKTYIAMARALSALKNKEVSKVVLSRPAVEAGEALGFLPGALEEKLSPYLRPLYDAIYDMLDPGDMEKYMDRGAIEIAPLAYMRGRTLSRAFVILDEAQNTTEEQMFMFLTRIGEGSRCIITGDPSQCDLKRGMRSGLREALRVLRGVDGVGFADFQESDVVRHPVVKRIIGAYNRAREEQQLERDQRAEAKKAAAAIAAVAPSGLPDEGDSAAWRPGAGPTDSGLTPPDSGPATS